jgi:hypothetical protein
MQSLGLSVQDDSGGKIHILVGHFEKKGSYEHYLILNGDEIELFEFTNTKALQMVTKKEKLHTVNFIVILM